MSKPFTPRPYQLIMMRWILDTPKLNIWAEMGMGKTSGTLAALNLAHLAGYDVFPALILAPLRVAGEVWPGEVEKWENLKHLRVSPILGSPAERLAAARKPADIYTINYENLPWLVERCGSSWPYKTIVADESTKLKGFRLRQGGKRAQALAQVAAKTKRFINLTGTPSANGLKDLWGQNWFIDKGERLGRSYSDFSARWFYPGYDGYSLKPHKHAQDQIESALRDVTVTLRAKDWFDIKEPIVNYVNVELPPAARRIYTEMERELFTELEGHEIEAFSAASRTMKCLQFANGAAYVDDKATKWAEVHDAKIRALEDIIEEAAGAPVLVAYHFRSDLERLQKTFPQGRVLDKNPKTLRDWNAGKIPVLFAHPASAGHGLNLQDGGNILVFFSVNWNLEEHLQIIERIGPTRQLQAGYNRPVFIHYVLAKNTVDAMILDRLINKKTVQDVLLEAMRKEH